METSGSFAVRLEAVGGTRIATTVENVGTTTATFCVYHTPFEGIMNDIFIVERGGRAVPYEGPLASRVAPGPEHYVSLSAGQVAGPETVDLEGYYDLRPGTYTVRYRGTGISGLPESPPVELVVP
jgi:hypothetical protein